MSDVKPRRGYSLGDEPDPAAFDDAHGPAADAAFRPPSAGRPIPQRALRTRDEWADVPWGEVPKRSQGSQESHVRSATKAPDAAQSRNLRSSLLLTLASAVLPGSGLLGAPQRRLKVVGAVTSLATLGIGIYFLAWALGDTASFATIAVDPAFLSRASFSLIALGLLWVALIATTHIATRPGGLLQPRRLLGAAVVTALAFGVAAPSAVGARYSHDQVKLVEKVFGPISIGDDGDPLDEVQSSSRPTLYTESKDDPWKGIPRVNVLLLGADGSEARADVVEEASIRTDTIIIASIDTVTGDTLLVQIPRNVRFAPFERGSELHDIWPDGFRGATEAESWLTSLWAAIELYHPEVLRGNTYRGAEALKQAVEGITGLEADYFMMLDIDGFQRLIDAMGGVRVNINEPLPKGTASNCRNPERCLMPGPNQKLDGSDAMWYARSRKTTSDYSRMARQSCLIDAVIKQANPTTMLTSYEGIADAASNMVTTDIPQRDLKAFVQLAFKVKDAKIQRLLYSNLKNGYSYENPDFEAMRQAVEDALNPPKVVAPTAAPTSADPSPSPSPSATDEPTEPTPTATETSKELVEGAQTVADACEWQGWPEDQEEEEG